AAREYCAALEEELRRLPERYQAPLLLCGLDGMTRDEAADHLGWSLGTFKRRLEAARHLLRCRLARRGLIPSAALCASLLYPDPTQAALSAGVVSGTARAAVALAEGRPLAEGFVSARAGALARAVLRTLTLGRIGGAAVLVVLTGF